MVFRRELGTAAAVLFRETRGYNDDRLMYRFLKPPAAGAARPESPPSTTPARTGSSRCGAHATSELGHSLPIDLSDYVRFGQQRT
jgi:hypothetical protein